MSKIFSLDSSAVLIKTDVRINIFKLHFYTEIRIFANKINPYSYLYTNGKGANSYK